MKKFAKKLFQILWQEEEGQDLVEYALLVVLVALGAIASMQYLAAVIAGYFRYAAVVVAHVK